MRLLFITQKLHDQDSFTLLWIRAFAARGYEVTVLCLENRVGTKEFPIYSLGKEEGNGKLRQIGRFCALIFWLKYDRVFIHMTPVWGLIGAWWWIPRRMPVYLWYTHYKMQPGLWMLGLYGRRLFCATDQSLPQYRGSPKKVVTGHGIDLAFWPKRPNTASDPRRLLMVHRLARSKRVELSLRSLTLLPDAYTLDIYGIEPEPAYAAELRSLVQELGLSSRVTFRGTVPAADLAHLYQSHQLILNMASETIDKTMLEAMTCGCYPVTTIGNAKAIGLRPEYLIGAVGGFGRQVGIHPEHLIDATGGFGRQVGNRPEHLRDTAGSYDQQVGSPVAPAEDTPEAIARFIQEFPGADPDALYATVAERHSLEGLVAKMDEYIRSGT